VSEASLVAQIERRAARANLTTPLSIAPALAAYLELLARWNRRINLTAYPLEPPSDEAIDHLIVEPLLAARHVSRDERRAIDVGSGGGSPAVPLALASPGLELRLVESKTRKAAFLREVARHLSLKVEVENRRLDDLVQQADFEPADLVTIRAVRADERFLKAMSQLVKATGRVFWFTTETAALPGGSTFAVAGTDVLIAEHHSRLVVLRRQPAF
jgi:16S rRNA (guanine527-N7)-methyltransferase